MREMKFSKVYLLSQEEKRAFSMAFGPEVTVIQAGNGFGKSALLKSLYDTFGAEPHRVDQPWRNANVISAVDFEIDGERRTILKFSGTYTVFDSAGFRIFQTASVTRDLGPFLADLLDFRLLMKDRTEETIVPPPAYAFAPFYVDQDSSWSNAWKSFRRMFLPRSPASLADYHSGLKPNAYYVAQAARDGVSERLRDAEGHRQGLVDALGHLRQIEPETAVFFDLDDFRAETDNLLAESRSLYDQQILYREKLSQVIETKSLWDAQVAVTRAALAEVDAVFESAVGHPVDVECPSCGEHYSNDIAARFGIAADAEALIQVLHDGQEQQRIHEVQIGKLRNDVDGVVTALARVQSALGVRRNELSLGEVVAAEGRNAATRILRDRVQDVDGSIGSFTSEIGELSKQMRSCVDRRRTDAIKGYFSNKLTEFAGRLDVRVGDARSRSISSTEYARGSEGPRGLAAYYYAFLHTTREYGSSAFCPMVIDAPNQQGQDAVHLPAIMSFLVKCRPPGSQLILGVEDAIGIEGADAKIVSVGKQRNQLLSEEMFEEVGEHLRPYIAQLVG